MLLEMLEIFIKSNKEIIILIIIACLIGSGITYAMEGNKIENMNIEDLKKTVIELTGFTIEELETMSETEINNVIDNLINDSEFKNLIKNIGNIENIEDLRYEIRKLLIEILPNHEVSTHIVNGITNFITLDIIGAFADFWDYLFYGIWDFLPAGLPNPFR